MGEASTSQRTPLPGKLWLAVFIVWTLLLVTPGNWLPGGGRIGSFTGITYGKLLHLTAYAALAGSAGWLRGTLTRRTLISLSMILHGGLTELAQTQVPYREGCWSDVGLDSIGVVIGLLASRWWWPA
jgi:hypothetical protein